MTKRKSDTPAEEPTPKRSSSRLRGTSTTPQNTPVQSPKQPESRKAGPSKLKPGQSAKKSLPVKKPKEVMITTFSPSEPPSDKLPKISPKTFDIFDPKNKKVYDFYRPRFIHDKELHSFIASQEPGFDIRQAEINSVDKHMQDQRTYYGLAPLVEDYIDGVEKQDYVLQDDEEAGSSGIRNVNQEEETRETHQDDPEANVVNKDDGASFTHEDVLLGTLHGCYEMYKDYKSYEYLGLDLPAICSATAKRYKKKEDMRKDLQIINSLTYMRGFNHLKVLTNFTKQDALTDVKTAWSNLNIQTGKNPGPTTLTLGRCSLVAPHLHSSFLHTNHHVPGKTYLHIIPKVANCGSFVGCVPKDSKYDPLFYAGVIYNIWWDSITNKDKKTIVKSIVGFNTASRVGSVIAQKHKEALMTTWGLDNATILGELSWIEEMVNKVLDLPTKTAWDYIYGFAENKKTYFKLEEIMKGPKPKQ